MSVTPSSAIVGVFREQAIAEQAVDAFYNAGFTHEQVLRSTPGNSGGFFEELKNLFTGSSSGSSDVASDLTNMGISQEEAQYYAQEHSNGNTIVAVHAPGREQEAQSIMHQYGAYSAPGGTADSSSNTTSAEDTTLTGTPVQSSNTDTTPTQDIQHFSSEEQPAQDAQRPVNFVLVSDSDSPAAQTYTEPADSNPYQQEATDMAQATSNDEDTGKHVTSSSSTDYTSTEPADTYGTSSVADDTSSVASQTTYPSETQEETQTATTEPQTTSPVNIHDETPVIEQAAPIEPETQPEMQNAQPFATGTATNQPVGDVSNADTEPLAAHTADTDSSVTDNQDVQTASTAATNVVEPQTETSPIVTATTTDNTVTPESSTTPITTPDSISSTATSPSSVSSMTDTDDLEQLQAQYAAMQQQLQDVQAQLQAARQQEEHLRTAKVRQQQIETLRQQMQELQAQLAAAQAELQDTHARISQYQ